MGQQLVDEHESNHRSDEYLVNQFDPGQDLVVKQLLG